MQIVVQLPMLRFLAGGPWAALLLVLGAAASGPAPAAAQESIGSREVLTGQVVRSGSPVQGVPVTLHRVTASTSGPVAEQSTDARGEFRFRLPPPDTSSFSVFFVTAQHQSVRYFGEPIHRDRPAAPYVVEVYDTTSLLPGAVRNARRDMVLMPENDGGWQVNEVLRIHNSAQKTLVGRGERPAWQFRLPEGAVDFEAGEGELGPDDVQLRGEWVFLHLSLTPGDRELFVRYRLPARSATSELILSAPTDTLNLFVRQPAPELEVTGMTTTRVVDVEQERFVQYGATDLPEQAAIQLAWSGPAGPPVDPLIAGVAVAVLVLLGGTWAAIRNRPDDRGPPRAERSLVTAAGEPSRSA